MTDMQAILSANPVFARKVTQFITLHDAAEVLDELDPPHGDTAAFLREVATAAMQETGVGADFIEAMARSRPPLRTVSFTQQQAGQ